MMRHQRAPSRYKGIFDEPPFDKSKSFYVHGNTGTGKTYYAWSIANIFNKANDESRVGAINWNHDNWKPDGYDEKEIPEFEEIDVKNLTEIMIAYRGTSFEGKEYFISQFCTGNIIFDDIGSEYQSEFTQELLLSILDTRWNEELWTGFTSNLSIGKLPYGDRIKSRIAGIVGKNIHHLDGKDKRLAP